MSYHVQYDLLQTDPKDQRLIPNLRVARSNRAGITIKLSDLVLFPTRTAFQLTFELMRDFRDLHFAKLRLKRP